MYLIYDTRLFFFQFWNDTGTDADKGKNSKIKILG